MVSLKIVYNFLEITPLSSGVETLAITTKIIPQNITIPTKKAEAFSMEVENQTNVEIHILQGKLVINIMYKNNKSLGNFHSNGIPLAPHGVFLKWVFLMYYFVQ